MKSKRPIIYKTEEDKKKRYEELKRYNSIIRYGLIKKYNLKETKKRQAHYNNNEEFIALSMRMEEIANDNDFLVKLRDRLRGRYMELIERIANYHKEFSKLRTQRRMLKARLIKEYKDSKKQVSVS